MSKKKAFLVLGARSTGTRMFTEMLIQAGCYGDSTHKQRLDESLYMKPVTRRFTVWRRSVPHFDDKQFIDIGEMVSMLYGCEIFAFVMVREWLVMLESQVRAGHEANRDDAYSLSMKAYSHIIKGLEDQHLNWQFVSYEALVYGGNSVYNRILKSHGLNTIDFNVKDENAKYYK